MTDDIELYIDIDNDIMVIQKQDGELYAYRFSDEIELYQRLLGSSSVNEHHWIEQEGLAFQEMIDKDEEMQKYLEELEYEVYSQENQT